MPYAARKPCPIPGCPGLTADGQPCERHRRLPERVYDAQWRHLRLVVLQRDQGRCQQCGKPGNEVDHIQSVRLGGKTTLDNLQTLCKRCHSAKTKRGR